MRKACMLLFILLLSSNLATYAQEKHKDASYLIEGVEKIYVVDESRCSSPKSPDDAGRVYLIEGKEKIEKIRKALEKVTKLDEMVSCGCLGPDRHYYCFGQTEKRSYWSLDCGIYLNHCIALNNQALSFLDPSRVGFLGLPIGYAYLAEAPLSLSGLEIEKKAAFNGHLLLYSQDRIERAKADKLTGDSNNYLQMKLVIKMDNFNGQLQNVRTDEDSFETVGDILDKLFDVLGIKEGSITDKRRVRYDPVEKTILLTSDYEKIRPGKEFHVGRYIISVKEMSWKSGAEIHPIYYFEVFVVGIKPDNRGEMKSVGKALPELANIRCVCDRYPSPEDD